MRPRFAELSMVEERQAEREREGGKKGVFKMLTFRSKNVKLKMIGLPKA